MEKKVSILFALIISCTAYSQIGVNTPDPKATLDITAKNLTGTSAEGILIPRVDRQRAQSMTGVEISTLIYVNSIATGSQAGTAANIDAAGYYYFDGSAWIKLNAGGSSAEDTNIYNKDGSLSENRIVTQDANTLAFTGTAANAFSVDGTTFSVNANNHRVGIGTDVPAVPLDIQTKQVDYGFQHTNGTVKVSSYVNADTGWLGTRSAHKLIFMTGDGRKAAIDTAGRMGVGTDSPNESAILDLSSTNKGFLPPRMSTAQRDAIASKTGGLLIYNTSVNIMQYWNGSTWVNYQ